MDLRKKVLTHKRRVSIGGSTTELSQNGLITTGSLKLGDENGHEDYDGELGRESRENLLNCEKLNPLGLTDPASPELAQLELDDEYQLFMDDPPCPILKQSNEFLTRSLLDSAISYEYISNQTLRPDKHAVGSHRRNRAPASAPPLQIKTVVEEKAVLSRSSSQDTDETSTSSTSKFHSSEIESMTTTSRKDSSGSNTSSNSLTTVTSGNSMISIQSEPSFKSFIKKKKTRQNFWSLDKHNIFHTDVPTISEKSKAFISLLKEVSREKDQIMDRNNKSLRNFLSKLSNTLKVMIDSGSFRVIAEDIKFIGEITVKSGYFIESVRSMFRLMGELRNTDETLTFFMEVKKMVKVANNISKAITNQSQTYEMFQIEEKQRVRIVTSLKNLINFVLHNEEFIVLIKNIENLKKQVSIAKEEQRKIFPIEGIRDIMKDAPITNDIILALQSVVGENINIETMSRNMREVINFTKTNRFYTQTFKEFTDLVSKIYSMDEMYLNEELETRARSIIDNLEKIFIEICALPSMVEFRVQSSQIITSLKRDSLNIKFIEDIKQLFKSIMRPVGSGEKKKYRIDYDMFNEIKQMLIPMAIEKIRSIPLPIITNMDDEKREKKIDFKLEDINIKLTFFDPNCFTVGLLASIQASPLTLSGKVSSLLIIELSNIKFRIDNMKWYFRKYGIPSIKDTGFANVYTGEKGIDIKVKLAVSQELFKEKKVFKLAKVKCKMNDIHIQILNSKHNKIYEKIFKLFQKKIKAGLEDAIMKKMCEKIEETERTLSAMLFSSGESTKKITVGTARKVEKKVQRDKIKERIGTEVPARAKSRRNSQSIDLDHLNIKDFLRKDVHSDGVASQINDTASVDSSSSHPKYCDNLADLKRITRKSLHHRRSSLGGRIETSNFTDVITPKLDELTIMRYHQFGIPLDKEMPEDFYTHTPSKKASADPFL